MIREAIISGLYAHLPFVCTGMNRESPVLLFLHGRIYSNPLAPGDCLDK